MERTVREAETDMVFSALGSSTRRALLGLMVSDGERPVAELAEHFAISRPSVSEHLKVLKDAGLVAERKAGRQRFYRVEPGPLLAARGWFDTYERFWRERMAALRDVVESNLESEDE
jgi:DNA-binding transcriptional ArsR family regulator